MFLSMADSPTGVPLRLVQTEAMKQRYNVAASRAKDRMFLIHSLDPNVDLKAGDLRRRLIEHVRDPGARVRATQKAENRAESPFEKQVIKRLVAAGLRIEPQVWIGGYRVDMLVGNGARRVVFECDGDRFHGIDQIPNDMARQAVLERAGWQFVRVRGTRFYRAPDVTTRWIIEELGKLGIEPTGFETDAAGGDQASSGEMTAIFARAREIMREQLWLMPVAG